MSKRDKNSEIRNIEIRNIILMVTITLIIGAISLMFYITKSKENYISYDEKSDVNYLVLLNDNEFYDTETKDKKQTGYVAALIRSIEANFRYKLDFYEKMTYRYSYSVVAELELSDKDTGNKIYHYTEDLKKLDLKNSEGLLVISEDVSIDYQKYNDIASKFKEVYDLTNVVAKLNVSLYSNVQNIDKSATTHFLNQKVCSLTIPVAEKTVSVDLKKDITDNVNQKVEAEIQENYGWILMISLTYVFISIVYIFYLLSYISKTRTAQMIYDKEIKSIMNHYDHYIQRITGSYNMGTSQVLKIESFSDMLEIRDTLKQPILMLENEAKDGTFFIIPATNSIIYTYALRVVDIKAKMDGNEVPTYDITEIPQMDFVKNKKYTDKYIKEQITMTTSMPVVDERNVIKGTKDEGKDLYDQLEMTRSFDVKEIRKAALETKKAAKKAKKGPKEKKETKKTTKKVKEK